MSYLLTFLTPVLFIFAMVERGHQINAILQGQDFHYHPAFLWLLVIWLALLLWAIAMGKL